MTTPRPLSAEIVAAVRRWVTALRATDNAYRVYLAEQTVANVRTWDLEMMDSNRRMTELRALALADPAPKPARVPKSCAECEAQKNNAEHKDHVAKPARRRGR